MNKLIQYLIDTKSPLEGSLALCDSIELYPAYSLYQDRPVTENEFNTLVPGDEPAHWENN